MPQLTSWCAPDLAEIPSEIHKIRALGPEKAVDSLINAPPENYPPPAWATPDDEDELRAQVKEAATPEEKQMANKLLREKFVSEMKDLTRWWLARIVDTPSPLIEKMTLFWHGHFATSGQKVRPAYKMWRQNETFRQNALGQLSHARQSRLTRSGDDDLAGYRPEQKGIPERKFRTRSHGALHFRGRALYRVRR